MPPDERKNPKLSARAQRVEALFDDLRAPGRAAWESAKKTELARETHVLVTHKLLDRYLAIALLESIARELKDERLVIHLATPTPQDFEPFARELPRLRILPTQGGEGRVENAPGLTTNDLPAVSKLWREKLRREDPESFTLLVAADVKVLDSSLIRDLKQHLVETGASLVGHLIRKPRELPSVYPILTFGRTGFFAEHLQLELPSTIDGGALTYPRHAFAKENIHDTWTPLWMKTLAGAHRSFAAQAISRFVEADRPLFMKDGRDFVAPQTWRLVRAALDRGPVMNVPPKIRKKYKHLHASMRPAAKGHDQYEAFVADSKWYAVALDKSRRSWRSPTARSLDETVPRDLYFQPSDRWWKIVGREAKDAWRGATLVSPVGGGVYHALVETFRPRRLMLFDANPAAILKACVWAFLVDVSRDEYELFSRWLSRPISSESGQIRVGAASDELQDETMSLLTGEREARLFEAGWSREHVARHLSSMRELEVRGAAGLGSLPPRRNWAPKEIVLFEDREARRHANPAAINIRSYFADFQQMKQAMQGVELFARQAMLTDVVHSTIDPDSKVIFYVSNAHSTWMGWLGHALNDHTQLMKRLRLLHAAGRLCVIDSQGRVAEGARAFA